MAIGRVAMSQHCGRWRCHGNGAGGAVMAGENASLYKEQKVATALQFSGLRYEKRGQSRVYFHFFEIVFGRFCERGRQNAGLGCPKSTC